MLSLGDGVDAWYRCHENAMGYSRCISQPKRDMAKVIAKRLFEGGLKPQGAVGETISSLDIATMRML